MAEARGARGCQRTEGRGPLRTPFPDPLEGVARPYTPTATPGTKCDFLHFPDQGESSGGAGGSDRFRHAQSHTARFRLVAKDVSLHNFAGNVRLLPALSVPGASIRNCQLKGPEQPTAGALLLGTSLGYLSPEGGDRCVEVPTGYAQPDSSLWVAPANASSRCSLSNELTVAQSYVHGFLRGPQAFHSHYRRNGSTRSAGGEL